MKYTLLLFVIVLLSSAYVNYECPEGINLLPMYGKAKKCKQQIESDSAFLKDCDQNFNGNRKQASKYYTSRGWQYFYKNKLDTAMFRFNQAWLLDSSNADAYWGMGNIEGVKKDYYGSLPLFERSLKLDPSNAKVYESEASSLGQLFVQTKNMTFLNTAIKNLKTCIKLEPNNPRTYAELTTAYAYFTQKDSAKKYLKITDKLTPNAVNPQIRHLINGY